MKASRWRLLFVLVAFALYFSIAAVGPPAVGFWNDDSIYIATAKSLAERAQYRHVEMPTEPLQTKYPILYPAILALVFKVAPDYPRNIPWLLLPTTLAAAAYVVLSGVYLHRVLHAPRNAALFVGALATLAPAIVSFVRFVMSEYVYALLSVLALICLDHRYRSEPSATRRLWWVAAAAVLIGLAVLTRTIGFSLGAAATAVLLLKRRYRDAALLVFIIVMMFLPWLFWRAWAVRVNGPLQTQMFESIELSYVAWISRSVSDTVRVVMQNTFRSIFDLVYGQLVLPKHFILLGLNRVSWLTFCVHAACYLTALLVGVGFVKSTRRGWKTLHVYAILYFAIVLAWPYEPHRFVDLWTPFILYFLFAGLAAVVPQRLNRACLGVVGASVFGLFLIEDVRIARSDDDHFYLRANEVDWGERRAIAQWVRSNTLPADIIASNHPAALYLTTGRRGFFFWPDVDPYARYYGADRSWKTMFLIPAPSEASLVYEQMRLHLRDAFRHAGVRFVVEETERFPTNIAFPRIRAENPDLFTLQYVTPRRKHQIYRVNLSPQRENVDP
jgi:hypothetical protein